MTSVAPILSIVIPCYNQGNFLEEAINSILNFNQPAIEIVLVDDGSTDNTATVAGKFPQVVYLYQENQGLASARNNGIAITKGTYISCLDADDWYLKDGLLQNLAIIEKDTALAFVSGCHVIQFEDGSAFSYCIDHIQNNYYQYFLEGNFIGNPSAVIYRKSILMDNLFDSTGEVVGCEDYDQYLKISKKYKVKHNPIPISVYRRHANNMSNNHAMMLNSVLNVMERQLSNNLSSVDMQSFKKGLDHWINHYDFFPLTWQGKRQWQTYNTALLKKLNWKLPSLLFRKFRKRYL
jgi:glycosyltransferase involved in cell wall biosynthesis